MPGADAPEGGTNMTATHTATRTVTPDSPAESPPAAVAPESPAKSPAAPAAPASSPGPAGDAACAHSPAASPAMTRERAETVADVFKVLADPSRVLILEALKEAGELCVLHLADSVGMSQSAVSHNLRLLRHAGLVARRRHGRLVYYRPDDDHVTGLVALCADHVAHRTVPSPDDTARQEEGSNA